MMDFSGKTAFVTGAANGIGLGICRALARNGVNLVLADIEQAQLDVARRELSTFNIRTHAIEVDVSDAEAFARAADEADANSATSTSCSTMPVSRLVRHRYGK
jgi:NAD(P)-dependent dehydrogenase (short-subunit alcohol dehydrogenase family)